MDINEGTSFSFIAKFTNQNGLDLTPDEVEWWVINPRDLDIKLTKQSIIPTTHEVELLVTSSVNLCANKRDENRLLVTRAISGTHEAHYSFPYTVIAIPSVPYS